MPRRSARQSSAPDPGKAAWAAAGLVGSAALGAAYASGVERNAFVVRRYSLPLLPAGSTPLKILHVSDFHMMPGQRRKQAFVRSLAALEPDLVIDTGDNLSSPRAVPSVVQALGSLLEVPGAFVFGSNDYVGPVPRNPLSYVGIGAKSEATQPLPWRDLRAAFTEHGWVDVTHRRTELTVEGSRILISGVDDPHIGRDRYDEIAGPVGGGYDLRIGLVHSPEPRVLDRFDADGTDLVLAGHTHGGQVRLPTGAIITNCGIDRSRARGVSAWGRHSVLHVSAGLGTSPYAPVRTFCRPEVSLLTLTGGRSGGGAEAAPVDPVAENQPELVST